MNGPQARCKHYNTMNQKIKIFDSFETQIHVDMLMAISHISNDLQ